MSSDGYFDDEVFLDESALRQLDEIEAAHFSPGKKVARQHSVSAPRSAGKPIQKEDSSFDLSFNVNEEDLARLDTFVEDVYKGKAIAGPSNLSSTSSSNKLQQTLFGEVIPPTGPSNLNKMRAPIERTKSVLRNPFGQQAPKTKQWDHTAFSKTGIRKSRSKGKGKGKGADNESGEENVEFEQFPAPFIPLGPQPPMKLTPDLLEAKHWIFPINRPKRDYQYNIVKNCLFENTLVALPTGLGKTFIAGVLMLNYYRWFPEGKVVFVAPTKPLVSQQITACHETCGIPGGDSIELNGEVSAVLRARHWKEKRVFFMTPQTLVNDLVKENCNVTDIVLLVIDEAHRGTGDYAYNQAIRFLMAKNPHFRVLALTATPGNSTEAVQSLIDGLHISRIEIRNEQSLDLKKYIHKKVYKPHIIKANEDVARFRDLLVKVMDPLMKPIQKAGLFFPSESAISLHPYRIRSIIQNEKGRFYSALSMLGHLAHAMLYLLTGSFEACYDYLKEISKEGSEDPEGGNKKNSASKKFKEDTNFKLLMRELETQRACGWNLHPKVEKLKAILIQHFGSKLADGNGEENTDDTKIMVFSAFRAVVDEIVGELDKERPLIRAARFIGQGVDKQGKKGMTQKDQIEIIKKFKAGEYNVLVATCIGEEGLDIGEIDVAICYDANKAPTRMVQRFGRTGRRREGTIHALLAEGREERNIDKADATYREVQEGVNKGEMYELYNDVPRLIPDHIKPECIEKVVEIQEFVREDGRKRRSPKKGQATKRKRNDDVLRNVPDGASAGFVSVRDLIVKGSKKRPKTTLDKNFDACGQDDETDEDIESGHVLAPPRRTRSAAASSFIKKTGKDNLRRSSTTGTSNVKRSRQKKKGPELTNSQFYKQGLDDSDDMDIEQGRVFSSHDISPKKQLVNILQQESPLPTVKAENETVDEDMSWLVDDDDDNLNFEIVDSSPERPLLLQRMKAGNKANEISRPHPRAQRESIVETYDHHMETPNEIVDENDAKQRTNAQNRQNVSPTLSPSKKANSLHSSREAVVSPKFSSSCVPSSSPLFSMAFPSVAPHRFSVSPENAPPDASYPTRPMRNPAEKRRVIFDDDEVLELPPVSKRRLRRSESSQLPERSKAKSKAKKKLSLLSRNVNPLFDGEAIHSGDEVSEGCSNSADDVESESDRLFIKDGPHTQVPQSYDQSMIYRRSLLTQATPSGPAFANKPSKHKPFGNGGSKLQQQHLPSSSPPPPDDELDHYDLGSFVVDDEAEISYEF